MRPESDAAFEAGQLPQVPKTSNLDHLQAIAEADVAGLKQAQKSYGDSWKKRGGVGAFMMLARKWDRLEIAMTKPVTVHDGWTERWQETEQNGADSEDEVRRSVDSYDIFERTEADERSEGLIDDIRDLRRYLLLVESEMIARGIVHGAHRDNKS